MKVFVTAFLLLSAGSAAAHNVCNLEVDAGVRMADNSIAFYGADDVMYKIVDDKKLLVNGQVLSLTQEQQMAVVNYAASIRAAVPEVRSMALDGIDLAIDVITITFDSLLGERNQISAQLITELSSVKIDVDRYFTSGNPISFNHNDEDVADFLGKNFETRIERIVETSVQNSIGSIMIAMGKQILASGGDMEAFEARMNNFGEQLETQMNAKAAGMEVRGKKLCMVIEAVDMHEEQLKRLVPVINRFNVIRRDSPDIDVVRHDI